MYCKIQYPTDSDNHTAHVITLELSVSQSIMVLIAGRLLQFLLMVLVDWIWSTFICYRNDIGYV